MAYKFTPRPGTIMARMQAAQEALDKRLADDPEFRAEWHGMMEAEAAKYEYDAADDYDGGPA